MSDKRLSLRREGAVVVLCISNPPVNALSQEVRAALWQAIEAADADPHVEAVVLTAQGRTFPAGADISEFTQSPKEPGLSALCTRLEQCAKPVVAALHGTVLGGGFELALGAHYRVAQSGTRLGFPEIKLGILPGAGGTQRAPRLAGAGNALALMQSGESIAVESALAKPYVDLVVAQDVDQAAIHFAQDLLRAGAKPRPTAEATVGLAQPGKFMAEIARQKEAVADAPVRARREIVNAVEAALLLPLEAGLDYETAAFEACNTTREARALQHMFFADRRAAKAPVGAGSTVVQLGIAGSGIHAMALTAAALEAGLAVACFAPSAVSAATLNDALVTALDRAVEAGRLSPKARDARLARFVPSKRGEVLSGCEIIIGCGPEEARMLSDAGPYAGAQTYLVTTGLHSLVDDSPLVGLHLEPEHDLAEILWSEASAPEGVATLMALMRKLGRVGVAVRDVTPVAPRLKAYQHALAGALLSAGATKAQLNRIVEQTGMGWALPEASASLAGPMPEEDILRAMRSGMAAQGMALLRKGVLARASDLDVLAVQALGYARWSGGPMHMSEAAGFVALERDIARFGQTYEGLFPADPALSALATSGAGWRGFEALLSRPKRYQG
ncbi:enoyl-CoA hydratase-related protein [Primorskyibacter sp. S187A]|uniref:enoyl-CoA hydratase-related protein n=1 Tax=Primorskyibacter sp. S187A TaxID=3415130 RepID=UPI003C7D7728